MKNLLFFFTLLVTHAALGQQKLFTKKGSISFQSKTSIKKLKP